MIGILRGIVRKPLGFLTKSDSNWAVQPKKMARCIEKVERLYYLCSKNKGADQTAQLICAFVFSAYVIFKTTHLSETARLHAPWFLRREHSIVC